VDSEHAAIVKIRILRVPPTRYLEGFDIRSYFFRAGAVYAVSKEIARVLIDWGYAEAVDRTEEAT
jgi:hypothetical protein